MRTSIDEMTQKGIIENGFDYNLQVWVLDGIIQDCGHPADMKRNHCCNSHALAGNRIEVIQGHEVRP